MEMVLLASILLLQLMFGRKIVSVVQELEGVKAQLRKAKIELSSRLADLNATIVNLQGALEATGGVDVRVVAALADVKAAAQEIDDLVPDVADLPVEPVVAEEVPVELPAEVTDEPVPTDVPDEVPAEVVGDPIEEDVLEVVVPDEVVVQEPTE